MSLCWVSATGLQEIFYFKRGTIGRATRGLLECTRGFSFAETKGGLEKAKKGALTKKRYGVGTRSTPENCSSGVKPTSFPG